MNLRTAKNAIRAFLKTEVWTEEKLCALLAHAESNLCMVSCCCLIGVPTADHALQAEIAQYGSVPHYLVAKSALPLAQETEHAFYHLATEDELRRKRIRPMVRHELKQRAALSGSMGLNTPASADQKECVL